MRLLPDEFYDNASMEDLQKEFERLQMEFKSDQEKSVLAAELKKFHRTRTLACWHDASTVSNSSHFLVLVNLVFDKAVFYTSEELYEKTGKMHGECMVEENVFLVYANSFIVFCFSFYFLVCALIPNDDITSFGII